MTTVTYRRRVEWGEFTVPFCHAAWRTPSGTYYIVHAKWPWPGGTMCYMLWYLQQGSQYDSALTVCKTHCLTGLQCSQARFILSRREMKQQTSKHFRSLLSNWSRGCSTRSSRHFHISTSWGPHIFPEAPLTFLCPPMFLGPPCTMYRVLCLFGPLHPDGGPP